MNRFVQKTYEVIFSEFLKTHDSLRALPLIQNQKSKYIKDSIYKLICESLSKIEKFKQAYEVAKLIHDLKVRQFVVKAINETKALKIQHYKNLNI